MEGWGIMNKHFVYNNDATHYEVFVNSCDNTSSRHYGLHVVSVVVGDLTECFIVEQLSNLAEHICSYSKVFATIDAINIHNAIAVSDDKIPFASMDMGDYFLKVQYT